MRFSFRSQHHGAGLALRTGAGLAFSAGLALLGADRVVARAASGRCFEQVEQTPDAPVALVLGCAEKLAGDRTNLYFTRRIAAAAELFHAGKVSALIVSGDNSRKEYDEPTAMKNALERAGVPPERVYCDFAGLRTLDSVVRAREIFGQSRFIVVSQRFHNERAVYLARAHGLEAFGFDAQPVGGGAGLRTRAREWIARVAAVLDVAIGATPKHLGPPVEIAAKSAEACR